MYFSEDVSGKLSPPADDPSTFDFFPHESELNRMDFDPLF